MGLGKSAAVVIGNFPLGESDSVVTFFSRDFGKIRGVAKSARRMPSKFGAALELLTLGELVFFDTGRSDLVRIDHFDIVRPFAAVRDDLQRLGETAWSAECIGRLTAERDPQRALYGLLVRILRSVEAGVPPRRAAVVFGVRCVDALGHRLRLDVCVTCGRRPAPGRDGIAVDVEAGGVVCAACATDDLPRVAPSTVTAFSRLRTLAWDEAVRVRLGTAEAELRALLDHHVSRLIGQPTRTTRFLREVARAPAGRS
ncbi:MAG: DNA repair protein RecO [Candidatus Rokubacteria bacterium]|nr:DNA repair protein RecO [Candidatus Rokubacteria bacterium]MBI3824657.1 DNA repair protein RecO [Candidatus Rokubacteria bacterium]